MKKLLTLLLALSLLLGLSGCGKATPEDVLKKAYEKTRELKSFSLTVDAEASLSGLKMDFDDLLTLKLDKLKEKMPNVEVDFSLSFFGQSLSMKRWMVDGKIYEQDDDGEIKVSDAQQGEAPDTKDVDILKYVKVLSMEEDGKNKVLSLEIDMNKIKEEMEQAGSALDSLTDELGNADFSNLKVTIDPSYHIIKASVAYDGNVEGIQASAELSCDFFDFDNTAVKAPK